MLTAKQNGIIENHFKAFPDRAVSSRHVINEKCSSFYDSKTKRLRVHRNNRRKNGYQELTFEHSKHIVKTLTSNHTVKYHDLRRCATPRELADYHGFPSNYILPTAAYVNLFGNTVSVPVAVHVFQLLHKHGNATSMIDLCSGIGAFHIAAKQVFTDIKCIGFSEIKASAIKTYKKNFPTVPNLGNVKTAIIPKCDLVCAGFPCQPFSSCKTDQKKHSLIGMYKYILNAIEVSEAHFVVLENVRNILKRNIFKKIKSKLLSMGYIFNHVVLNSKDFDLKQNRIRVFMYAYKKIN